MCAAVDSPLYGIKSETGVRARQGVGDNMRGGGGSTFPRASHHEGG